VVQIVGLFDKKDIGKTQKKEKCRNPVEKPYHDHKCQNPSKKKEHGEAGFT
jgi:hypothetical protein